MRKMPTLMTIKIDQRLPSFEQLPNLFAIELDNIGAISLIGEDQSKYLQGQVTCDVNAANENSLLNGSHCDAKGKVFSAFRFIMRNKANLLLQPKVTLTESLAALKKFGVFAKVDITVIDNLSYLAVCGVDAETTLKQHFPTLPNEALPVETVNSTTVVYIAGTTPRYLLIDEKNIIEALANALNIATFPHAVWTLIEITEGFPTLNEAAITTYVPQMLNLQAVNAISFTKGCYLGQETVARMQYLGKNKRALYSLKGQTSTTINTESVIEKQLGENWRKAGDILATYTADNGEYFLQAVLASDTDNSINLRIKESTDATLQLQPLPYSLTTQD